MIYKKYTIMTLVLFAGFLILNACSSGSTGPGGGDNTISGNVTLSGQSDHSTATVMVFQTLPLDTVLTNLNDRYPNQGITVSQNSEFQWWDYSPVKEATVAANGSWSMNDITLDRYNIVVSAPGYGWRIKYDASGRTHNFELSETIQLNTTYTSSQAIPSDSYVEVSDGATFSNNAALTIEAGVIVEFLTNARLEVNGPLNVNGSPGSEVFFVAREAANNTNLILDQANNSNINYAILQNMEDGLLISSSNTVKVTNTRIKNGLEGINLFNSQSVEISNCVISDQTNGIVSRASSQNLFLRNYILTMSGDGLGSLNENSSRVQNNIFKSCVGYGLNINTGGSPGSLIEYYHFDIINNDFTNNTNHIRIGRKGLCAASGNNFLGIPDFTVWTSDINANDSLNFNGNYWGSTNPAEIAFRIFDRIDTPNLDRPVIDFINIAGAYINW